MDNVESAKVQPADQESVLPSQPTAQSGDPAIAAFEALREEVALARRAVAGLAAERAALEIPDYRETLAQLLQVSTATVRQLEALNNAPAVQMSASRWAHEIARAAEPARRDDHYAFRNACSVFESAAQNLNLAMDTARSAERQRIWLIRTGIAGLIAGMALSALIAWMLLPSPPATGQSPEQRAAAMLGMSEEKAGEHLLQTASPKLWQDVVLGDRIVIANRATLNRCLKKVHERHSRAERCVIEMPLDQL